MAFCPETHPLSLYNCSNPYPNCVASTGFQFPELWKITQYVSQCPSDPRLFSASTPALTQAACAAFVGAGIGWTLYPGGDIWNRLTSWKFPLLQLIALFPRPPLGPKASFFAVFHHLGDPIGTLRNLLLKIASCQSRAVDWSNFFNTYSYLLDVDLRSPRYTIHERTWKAFAVIVDSYDEWGFSVGNQAQMSLISWLLSRELSRQEKRRLMKACIKAADALSADRSTKFLPVTFALIVFIGGVALAVGRTKDPAAATHSSINIEAHSIAFSALYFWIILTTVLAAVVGASQTEKNMPRILCQLERRIQRKFPSPPGDTHPLPGRIDKGDAATDTATRIHNGGLYAWYPEQVRREMIQRLQHMPLLVGDYSEKVMKGRTVRLVIRRLLRIRPGSGVFAVTAVLCCLLTGVLISALVPPIGFGCRCKGEVAITAVWLGNAALDYMYSPKSDKAQFWYKFTRDLVATLATMCGIIVTQIGVFNRCECYTAGGTAGLALPQATWVAQALNDGMQWTYPAIAFLSICAQLFVFPLCVYLQYPEALRVFLQRDDGYSNLWWWHHVQDVFARRRTPSSNA